MTDFSAHHRQDHIRQLESEVFDLLVVGGGITGAGIALDASARGLKVALVEMQDFAGGTSGRSTKLIHGGLRYLKQLELGLVAEVGQERAILHRLAPHLTKPEPMLLPIRGGDAMGPWMVRLGMFIYERLARVLSHERHNYLVLSALSQREPLLRQERLRGGVLFYEYRTDDARLTLEVLKQAVARGTIALSHLSLTGFAYDNRRVSGAQLRDELYGTIHHVRSKYVVNATGPWVDALDNLNEMQAPKLKITKGVHLVFDRSLLPVSQAVYFEAFDKRMLFVIPRGDKTYVGTTDTFYTEKDLKDPEVGMDDRDYLLQAVNRYFRVELQPDDITSAWAGLRPLIGKKGKKAGEISRKDEIFISETGLVTIAGGKLTGYRKMAVRVMTVIAAAFQRDAKINLPPSTTDTIFLSEQPPVIDIPRYLAEKINEAAGLGIDPVQTEKLVYRYGPGADSVLELVRRLTQGTLPLPSSGLPLWIYAQLIYALQHEMCLTAADFFIRRTGMIYFDTVLVETWKGALRAELGRLLPGVPDKSDELDKALERIERLRRTN